MQPFVIELRNLASGSSSFEWQAGSEFFEAFGNPDVVQAAIKVSAKVQNSGLSIGVTAQVSGSVTVPCDRCLDNLQLPVNVELSESYVPEEMQLDLSQDIYDYIITSLPLQRVHPNGECNSDITKFIATEQ